MSLLKLWQYAIYHNISFSQCPIFTVLKWDAEGILIYIRIRRVRRGVPLRVRPGEGEPGGEELHAAARRRAGPQGAPGERQRSHAGAAKGGGGGGWGTGASHYISDCLAKDIINYHIYIPWIKSSL